MNILLTSVGRRAYMVKYFKEVVGLSGEVHAVNSDDKTVAFQYADKATVCPLIYDKSYIPFLLNYCQENRIDAVISLFDMDLLMLAKNKKKFEKLGTRVIVSDEEIVGVCNDKWKSYEYLKENGFNVPKTYLSYNDLLTAIENKEISYPVIVKPRFGCGSIAVSKAYDKAELDFIFQKASHSINSTYLKYESAVTEDKVIFQECLNGQEYGADIINDLNGNYRNAIIKKKIAMRAGETDIAELVDNIGIKSVLEKLGKLTKHIANMDVDIFLVDGIPYVLEMNCRFGGGYPFSHMGGCNLPLAIVKWLNGLEVDDKLISAKTGITGYKELVITQK